MSQPFTIVTLIDEDGDEFPIRLPGVYELNAGSDYESAMHLLMETPELKPRGEVKFGGIEYVRP